MITKQQYLSEFRNNSSHESQLRFLAKWCDEEERDFKSLMKLVDVVKLFKKQTLSFNNIWKKHW